jgi:hypothetical protein
MTRVPGTYDRPRARVWPGPIPGTHEPGFVEQPILERADLVPAARVVVHGQGEYELRAFTMGECRILLGHEPADGELRWHLTISCLDRHPTWDEIKTARYRLLGPDLNAAMFLPPAADYVNVATQDHVFQVWEVG